MKLTTPDGRYFVVKDQLWRCTDPSLAADERQLLVNELMNARREVKAAKASGDVAQLKVGRSGGTMAALTTTDLKLPIRPMLSGTWRLPPEYL